MDDIWKKAAKKLRAREHRAATCAATASGVETDTTTATTTNSAVAATENTATAQTAAPNTNDDLETELLAIEREWLALERGPLPEEYRVRIDQIRAREAAKLMEVEGDENGVVREREGQTEGSREEGEGKEGGKKVEEARVEEIVDEERERRRKRNEKKKKRKMEKEKERKEKEEEEVEKVRTVPSDSNDDTSSRAPTEHVNVSTTSPRHFHVTSNAISDITSPARTPTTNKWVNASDTPLTPSVSTKPPPASSNDPVAPTKPAPTSSKPAAASFTGDVAPTTVQTDGNGRVRGVRSKEKGDMKDVRTTTDTTGDDATCLAPSSFDWADDVDTTITTTIALVAPVARAPRDFSGLRSSTRNPWGSLSRRHHRSHPRAHNLCHSFKYVTYNHALELPASSQSPSKPPSPAPIQFVETIRHPRGIAPTKPVIRIASPSASAPSHPSNSAPSSQPLSGTHSSSPSQRSCILSLDWSGDPLLAGLARILEALGWTRDRSAARTPLCLWGAHGIGIRG